MNKKREEFSAGINNWPEHNQSSQRQIMMKAWRVIFVVALVSFWMTVFGQRQATTTPSAERPDIRSLPDNLSILQQATGYLDWEHVCGYSRSLTHYRQLRISKTSNVFISETGAKAGQVDVVEVILMPLHAGAKAEFALYDPNSGKRITHYPDTIKFDMLGIHGGSRNAAPSLCIACHDERSYHRFQQDHAGSVPRSDQ